MRVGILAQELVTIIYDNTIIILQGVRLFDFGRLAAPFRLFYLCFLASSWLELTRPRGG